MKKLLGLLGTIMITGNAIPSVIAAAPNRKHSIKKRQNNENISTTSKTQDEQQPQFSTTSDSKVDIIEKEITLNENYSDNIQKILKELIKNNQLDPLRMINNEGIIRTDYFETQDKRNERESNIKIIEKLEEILELRKFDADKIRILVLTLKNKENNEIKLIINLDNFYLQGFINKNNQYFYFKEEKSLNEWKREIKKLTEELNKWNKINEEIKLLDLKKFNNNQNIIIIKEIDEIKENLKEQWGGKYKKNKEKINLLNENLFDQIQINNEDSESIRKLNELKEKIEALKKEKIYIGQSQEKLNIYQKIQQIRRNALNLLNKGKWKSENKKECEENIKNYKWDNVFNEINSIIESKINTIQHKKIKENKINEEIIKEYSINENKKNNLNYNGSYQDKGLNTVNQNIDISKRNLNNAISNLSKVNNDNKQNQTTKDDLAKVIFITSETMRFGSYIKYFNYEKNGKQVEFKNISTNIQKIIENKASLLNWKEYESQLIGGWIASSKYLEEKRKEIFKELNEIINISIFETKNEEKLNKILEKFLKEGKISNFCHYWDLIKKIFNDQKDENYKYLENNIFYFNHIKNVFIFNMLVKNNSGKKINITAKIPIPFSKASDYCNFLTSTIVLDNRDIFELLIMKKPELLNCDRLLTGYKPLHVAATNCKIDIVKSLLDNGVDINARTKKLSTSLILLSQDGGFWYKNSIISELKYVLEERTKLFKFLLNHGADPNLVNKDGDSSLSFASSWNNKKIVQLLLNFSNINVNIKNLEGDTPLHISVYHDHLDIVKLLLTKGANPNLANNNGVTPLHNAAFNSNLEIVKLLVDHGTNINAENKDGIVALRDAVKNGHTKIVRFLLEKGANVNIQIIEDATPFNGQIHFVDNKNIKLLNKYKDAVTKRKGWFILHYAVYTGNLEIVKLLLDHGANINVIDIYGVTPIYVAACKNYIEIIKLLLSSEQNTNIIIPIENISVPLLKNKKIIIFDETIDGKKPINLYYENEEIQNFLKKFNELNKKINICKNLLLKDNLIQKEKINKDLIDFQNQLQKLLELKTNDKEEATINKQNKKIESNFGGFKSGFLNQPPKSGNNSNSKVSVGDRPETSGTQNKNTKTTNHNNLYNVPGDGSCLFWSVATAFLLPVRNNNDEFRARFIKLFGEQELQNLLYVQNLFQQFDLENNNNNQLWYQKQTANNLVTNVFRNRVVDYIQSNLNMITNRGSELTFRNVIEENNEIYFNYLERMRYSSAWGGTPEILAISNMLNSSITINNHAPYQPINQNSSNTINIFHVNRNHYNFVLSNQTPQTDAEYKKSTVFSCLNEEDNDIENNSLFLNKSQLKKYEYHFIDQKTEQNSLKNNQNLKINLIKNNNKINTNTTVVNKPISTNKNMENLQTTTAKAINKYNTLSKA